MKPYTIILENPPFLKSRGTLIYHIDATDIHRALAQARESAYEGFLGGGEVNPRLGGPDDYGVVAIFLGRHENIYWGGPDG